MMILEKKSESEKAKCPICDDIIDWKQWINWILWYSPMILMAVVVFILILQKVYCNTYYYIVPDEAKTLLMVANSTMSTNWSLFG